MMICDGVSPSNEGRGYVLRRLLRRAARHGRTLGIKGLFLTEIVDSVVENYKGAYPELVEKEDYIKKMINLEEEGFNKTIDTGMDILNQFIQEVKDNNSDVLSGEKAFKLYDTYGFPYELTEEICEEKSIKVDRKAFDKEMEAQRVRAREAREVTSYMGSEDTPINKIDASIETEFVGYDTLEEKAKILVLADDENFLEELLKGNKGYVVTDKTPFYAEMGGQVGDTGYILGDNFKAYVYNTKKNVGGKVIHYIEVKEGTIKNNSSITMKVDELRRSAICKNHSATHMLQEALKEVVGDHTHQSGSYVDEERLRFDFNHFQGVTLEEIEKIEKIVNENIMKVYNVETKIMSLDEAKKSGAMALFDDKYGEKVRVVCIGEYSKELCGGTHVKNSGEIGLFKIVSESGVAAGIRRIEAVTGFAAIKYIEEKQKVLKEACAQLKCNEKELVNRIATQNNEIKIKEKEVNELKAKLNSGEEENIINSKQVINDINVVSYAVKGIDPNSLRDLADKVRDKIGTGLVVLLSDNGDKVSLVAMATKDAVASGVHCGKIIKEVASIVGGGGGGRPDMAQAGGKNPQNINEAVEKVFILMKSLSK